MLYSVGAIRPALVQDGSNRWNTITFNQYNDNEKGY
jgi:hypothetical protein